MKDRDIPPDPVAEADTSLVPEPVVSAAGEAPPSPTPMAPPSMPGAPPGLLYYAVYLPDPRAPGAASGLPVLLPAGDPRGFAQSPAPAGFVSASPPAAAPTEAAPSPARLAQDANQKLLVQAIIVVVFLVHLPWLLYLVAVHGCWGTFIEACSAPTDADAFSDTPMMFAQVSYFILRIQSVLLTDLAQYSNMLQLGTGLGSFVLTKIVASNGLVAQRRSTRLSLAGTCLVAFTVLFWAELHLTGTEPYAALADETVLAYIDQMLPEDFQSFSGVKANLLQYLQFLRLADALILGAALAMPSATKKT